ncbi:hypothetical protein Cni_G23998 [Canna indica]|uniref:Uncharacterized protein n=1 Tax=Canna indica TaxID=4628 RepID=A0AAQ3KX68_9LILI|nr:hypothetical protein Cni_G23998 [Canna indica]
MVAMAAISTSVASSPSSLLPNVRRRAPSFRCSSTPPDGERAAPLLQLAVGGVTELLRVLSPKKQRDVSRTSEHVPSSASSADDVLRILRADYHRAYFLTGDFTSDIYAEDCLFEDPTIKFRGRDQYSQNLGLLVPFFDQPSLRLEKIEKNYEVNFILASWTLRTYLKLPWRPLISIKGSTTYDLGKDFKIIRHAESWNVSALEAVGQIFKLGSAEIDE